jgi:lysophospholipase L1-like esterase
MFWACTGFLLSQSDSENNDEDKALRIIGDTNMPLFFEGCLPNIIQDSANSLSPFFEKLMQLRSIKTVEKPVVRIVHIGDSHVRSHEFTPAFNLQISSMFGNAASTFIEGYKSSGILEESGEHGIICHCIGINGATSKNFLDDKYIETISQLQPDLIVISLGTNESLGRYDFSYHNNMMESLLHSLKTACPDAAILYTTPPGAFKAIYNKAKRRRNRKIISFKDNENTQHVAASIKQFADKHNAACWDLFNIVGGNENACKNWLAGHFYKHDKLHFLAEGYELHGNLLYEALIDAYNNYVLNKDE